MSRTASKAVGSCARSQIVLVRLPLLGRGYRHGLAPAQHPRSTPRPRVPSSARPHSCGPSPQLPRHGHGALACERAAPRRDRGLGRSLNTPGDRIGPPMPCDAPTCLLPGSRLNERSKGWAHVPQERLAPSLRDAHHMLLAMPSGMRQAWRAF
jgi:hypothetical protein